MPDCGGRRCGSDGCGGACGATCLPGHESFEDYPLRPVSPFEWPETPFTFSSGLILTLPSPNEWGNEASVTSCEYDDSGFFGIFCTDLRSYIPDGFALMVTPSVRPDNPLEFGFSRLVTSVRVAVTDTGGAPDEIFHMDALDAAGAVVATADISAGLVSNWRNNWLRISVASPIIAHVRLYSDEPVVLALDNFYWE